MSDIISKVADFLIGRDIDRKYNAMISSVGHIREELQRKDAEIKMLRERLDNSRRHLDHALYSYESLVCWLLSSYGNARPRLTAEASVLTGTRKDILAAIRALAEKDGGNG